jgi:hypothetical protein
MGKQSFSALRQLWGKPPHAAERHRGRSLQFPAFICRERRPWRSVSPKLAESQFFEPEFRFPAITLQ